MSLGIPLETQSVLIKQNQFEARQIYSSFTSSFSRDLNTRTSTITGIFTTSNGVTIFIPATTGTIQDDNGSSNSQHINVRNTIIGATIGGVAFLVLVGAALFFLRRLHRRRKARLESFEIGSEHGQDQEREHNDGGDLIVDSVPRPWMVQVPIQRLRPQVDLEGAEMRDISRESDQATLTDMNASLGNISSGNLARDTTGDAKRAQSYAEPTVETASSPNDEAGVNNTSPNLDSHVLTSDDQETSPRDVSMLSQNEESGDSSAEHIATPESRHHEPPPHYSESVSS